VNILYIEQAVNEKMERSSAQITAAWQVKKSWANESIRNYWSKHIWNHCAQI